MVFDDSTPPDNLVRDPVLLEKDELAILWRQALSHLQLQMTRGTFDTWLKKTKLVARHNLRFTVAVKNRFAQDWLENRLYGTIQRTLSNLIKDDDDPELPQVEIDFVVKD